LQQNLLRAIKLLISALVPEEYFGPHLHFTIANAVRVCSKSGYLAASSSPQASGPIRLAPTPATSNHGKDLEAACELSRAIGLTIGLFTASREPQSPTAIAFR